MKSKTTLEVICDITYNNDNVDKRVIKAKKWWYKVLLLKLPSQIDTALNHKIMSHLKKEILVIKEKYIQSLLRLLVVKSR